MTRRLFTVVSIAVVVAVLCVLPFVLSDYNLGLVAQVGIFFIAVLGLNILTGYTGQISIGHGAFMMIGGYTTAVMSRDHHTNLVLTMVMAFAICFVVGVLLGLPALRLSGVYLALATFAFAVSVPQLPLQWSTFLGGRDGVETSQTVTDRLALRRLLGGVGDPARARLADPARPRSAAPSAPSATARSPPSRRGSSCPSTRRSPSGSPPRIAGVAGSLFVLATNGFAEPSEFGILLSLELLDRRRGRRASARSGGSSSAPRSSDSCRTSRAASRSSAPPTARTSSSARPSSSSCSCSPAAPPGCIARLRSPADA